MAVSSTYIGVIILLLILIGFVLTIIRTLANSAGTRIRHDMNKILSSYDDIINKKAAEYKELQAQRREEGLVESPNVLKKVKLENSQQEVIIKEDRISASNFIKNEVKHRDTALAEGYGSIKNMFSGLESNMNDNLKVIQYSSEITMLDEAISRLSKSLSQDSVFELSALPSDEQLAFFKENLKREDMIALDEYLKVLRKKRFNTIGFYDWIRTNSLEVDDKVIIRTSVRNDEKGDYDPSICEGYQIVTGRKIYDYSISKRDIQ